MQPGPRTPANSRAGRASQTEDDQRGVVGDADLGDELGQQGVGECVGAVAAVPYEGFGEPSQTYVDVLTAAFDEAVGVQGEGGAFGEGDLCLGAAGVFGSGAERGVRGLVEEGDGPVGVTQDGRG